MFVILKNYLTNLDDIFSDIFFRTPSSGYRISFVSRTRIRDDYLSVRKSSKISLRLIIFIIRTSSRRV